VNNLAAKKLEVVTAIEHAAKNGSNYLMQLLRSAQTGDSDVSHVILQIYPSTRNKNRLLLNCQYETVSRWALDLLLSQLEDKKATATADFFHDVSGMRGGETLRGRMFEKQV
jgi:hypothetical protein